MSYCVNPACQNPQNPNARLTCLSCGSNLQLNERYRAIQLLGEGGMERTFLAEDRTDRRDRCILKQLLPIETSLDPGLHSTSTLEKAIEVFNHDASQWQLVSEHPQIPTVLSYFEQDRRLYWVQEFIEGQTLQDELKQQGAFSETKIRELLDRLLPLLEFIHDRKVIHRDIKPEHILRRSTSELVLTDFGISKQLASTGLARTGTAIGTEGYAPPEQIRGGLAYPASDLYSLAVTCIQLLTQEWLDDLYDPLRGTWVWRDRLRQKGRDVSDTLAGIFDKLLKDGVNERYQSAFEVLQELNREGIQGSTQAIQNRQEEREALMSSFNEASERKTSLWKCVNTLKGHSGWVWSVAFSPDGHTLASGGADNTVILWNVNTGQRLRTLEAHSDLVMAVTFNPRSPMLASSSRDKNIILWNLETGNPIRTLGGWFSGHSELVNSLAFSPDGTMLASGSWDRKIILWNLETGKKIRTFRGHSSWVYSVAFSPNGKTLASGSRDGALILWDVNSGKPFFTLYSDSGLVDSVVFSPDGTTVAGGNFDGSIVLWDVATGTEKGILSGHTGRVNSIAFSPNGKTLASGCFDKTLIVWDLETYSQISNLSDHSQSILSVVFSPDGQWLSSGSKDETIKIWHAP